MSKQLWVSLDKDLYETNNQDFALSFRRPFTFVDGTHSKDYKVMGAKYDKTLERVFGPLKPGQKKKIKIVEVE